MVRILFPHIIFIVYVIEIYFCIVHAEKLKIKQETKTVKLVDLVDELHSLYVDAFKNEKTYLTRRFFDGHTQYTLHVQKLREVNGVKRHNLRAVARTRNQEPIIYINNPVEAGMSQTFLGINELKKIMSERIKNQKKEFDMNRNQHDNKPFIAKHIDNFASKIFDVKKHVKQEVALSSRTESSTKSSNNKLTDEKKTLHKENHTVNKKIKPKVNLSHVTKSTTKPRFITKRHNKTTTTLSKTVFDNLVTVTKTVAKKNITNTTPETSISKTISTVTTADAKITTDIVTAEIITTKLPEDVETNTTTVEDIMTTEPTFGEEITTSMEAVESTTTKSTAGDELTTAATVAIEDVRTETTVDEKITTEMVTDEDTTVKIADTTTETIVETTRTKQARPYVFMGKE